MKSKEYAGLLGLFGAPWMLTHFQINTTFHGSRLTPGGKKKKAWKRGKRAKQMRGGK